MMRRKNSVFRAAFLLALLFVVSMPPLNAAPAYQDSGGVSWQAAVIFEAPAAKITGGIYRDAEESYNASESLPLIDSCAGSSEISDVLMIAWSNKSEIQKRMTKEAAVVSFAVMHHTLRTYKTEYLRSITEGGKSVINQPANFKDWRGNLRSALALYERRIKS
jgi:hypothetical protein